MDDCKIGDTVYLNSGSPALTVTDRFKKETDSGSNLEMARVIWIGHPCQTMTEQFPVVCLTKDPTEFVSSVPLYGRPAEKV